MSGPTPEQWWSALSDADRVAYMDAALCGVIGYHLWQKLINAGINVPARAPGNQPWEYQLPEPYLQYARAQAANRPRPPGQRHAATS